MRADGWDIDLQAHVRRGGHVLGICGGYQMLGRSVADPHGIEGPPATCEGLGLLDVETVLERRQGAARNRRRQHGLRHGIAGLLVPNLAAAGLVLIGLQVPLGLVAVCSLATATAGFVMPDFVLRDEADKRRRAFRHTLSSYLDLVNVLLAGGAGIETALYAAADAGDGWGYQTIRTELQRARLTGQSPWDTFATLNKRLGINELAELAASVSLAGSHGARNRRLTRREGRHLRGHQIAETEAAAEAATERMTIPVAVLLFGFLVFIAYPAVVQITSVSGPHP